MAERRCSVHILVAGNRFNDPLVPAQAGTQGQHNWTRCKGPWIPAFAGMSGLYVAMCLALFALGAANNSASAQQPSPKIWDVQLGTPVGDLPEEEFVDPACGSNGGPPGLRIGSFEQFERCRVEASGLREVWFRY